MVADRSNLKLPVKTAIVNGTSIAQAASDYIVSVYLRNKISLAKKNCLFDDFPDCITCHFGYYMENCKITKNSITHIHTCSLS